MQGLKLGLGRLKVLLFSPDMWSPIVYWLLDLAAPLLR